MSKVTDVAHRTWMSFLLLEIQYCIKQNINSVFSKLIDYSKGFGGKYGVQKERVDQAC